MYADIGCWLALLKDDDRLADRAESLLDEHEDELEASLATVVELFLVEERLVFDRERAVTAILELATYGGDPDVVSQASGNIDDGSNTFDAFHAALSGGSIISGDRAYDELSGVNRIRLDSDENEDSAARVRRRSVSGHDRPGRVVCGSGLDGTRARRAALGACRGYVWRMARVRP
jgi:hypothetical protein